MDQTAWLALGIMAYLFFATLVGIFVLEGPHMMNQFNQLTEGQKIGAGYIFLTPISIVMYFLLEIPIKPVMWTATIGAIAGFLWGMFRAYGMWKEKVRTYGIFLRVLLQSSVFGVLMLTASLLVLIGAAQD